MQWDRIIYNSITCFFGVLFSFKAYRRYNESKQLSRFFLIWMFLLYSLFSFIDIVSLFFPHEDEIGHPLDLWGWLFQILLFPFGLVGSIVCFYLSTLSVFLNKRMLRKYSIIITICALTPIFICLVFVITHKLYRIHLYTTLVIGHSIWMGVRLFFPFNPSSEYKKSYCIISIIASLLSVLGFVSLMVLPRSSNVFDGEDAFLILTMGYVLVLYLLHPYSLDPITLEDEMLEDDGFLVTNLV
ncbi:hypothetical protein RCL1_004615 [Eukaryota sp. TZLM3-RCL]